MDELFESLLTRGRREQCAEEVNDMFKQGFVPFFVPTGVGEFRYF